MKRTSKTTLTNAIHDAQVEYADVSLRHGDNSGEAYCALQLLALAKQDCGKFDDAAKDFKRLADRQREQFLRGETDAVRTAARLGRCLWQIEEYASAREIQQQVLKITSEYWGPNSDVAVESAYKLAATLCSLWEFDHVQEWTDEVVNARLNDPGKDDISARQYLYNLADIYLFLGNYDVSLRLFRRVKKGGITKGRATRLVAASAFKIVNVQTSSRDNSDFERKSGPIQ
jgi:tetratricopeptide (TPR) repeat protein